MRAFLIFVLFLASAAGASAAPADNVMCDGRPQISLEQINGMFSQIGDNTEWDMSGPMLWGYFFTDVRKEDLAKLNAVLVEQDYRHVGVRYEGVWQLHVEKVESHSPSSLHQRNLDLYRLAAEHGVDCYDGMDVGPTAAED